MILLSNISAALSTIIARKLISTKHVANPDQLAFYDYSVAALFFCGTFLVQALFSGNLPEISFAGLFWVVTAATLGGVVPYLYFLKSARGLPAEKLADSNYISPITGAVAALILTGATLTVNDFLGLSIALIGLALGNNKLAPILHMPNTESIMNLEKTIIQKSVELEKVLIEGPKSKF